MTRTALLRLALVPAVIALLSSCASGPAQGGALQEPPAVATTPPGVASAPAATATPESPAAVPAPGPAQEWVVHTSPSGRLSFEVPAAWTVEDTSRDGLAEAGLIRWTSQAGAAALGYFIGPGGGVGDCRPSPGLLVETLDSAPVSGFHPQATSVRTPAAQFRAVQLEDRVWATIGITLDPVGPVDICPVVNLARTERLWTAQGETSGGEAGIGSVAPQDWAASGFAPGDALVLTPGSAHGFSFPTMDAARAYMQTPEYAQIMRVLTSIRTH